MKTVGIIAEYNPFHNGHQFHIEESRKNSGADAVVAIMSGNFTQRGEPAIVNKYLRAEMAIKGGADLVIELPTVFCIAGAEAFAKGGVGIARGLGLDYLSFGSESGRIDELSALAEIYAKEPPEFKAALREGLNNGLSYAKARSIAARICISMSRGEDSAKVDDRLGSNDILAVEYLKQLSLFDSDTKPLCIERLGSKYNDSELPEDHVFASASAIREKLPIYLRETKNLDISKYMPKGTFSVFNRVDSIFKSELNYFYKMFVTRLLTMKEEELDEIYGATEGLGNRIKNEVRYANNFDDLTERVISKRYTLGRLNRLYLQILFGLKREEYYSFARAADLDLGLYARVLGFNSTGAVLIKSLKKSEKCFIPIITNINKEQDMLGEEAKALLNYDILSTDLYNLVVMRDRLYDYSDYVRKPVKL